MRNKNINKIENSYWQWIKLMVIWKRKKKNKRRITNDAKNNKGWKPCRSTHTHTHTHTHTSNLEKIINKYKEKGNIMLSGSYYDTG